MGLTITWLVQKGLQQAGEYAENEGVRVGKALCHWMLFPPLSVKRLPLMNENQAPGDHVLSMGSISRK